MSLGRQFTQRPIPGIEGDTVVAGSGKPVPMGTAPGDRREDDRGRAEFLHRQPLDNGGQVTSWRNARTTEIMEKARGQLAANQTRKAELDSGQRAMFMTPKEIHERYQPLDGDRHDGGRDYGTDEANWQPNTGTPERFLWDEDMENDEQLWERKLDESQMSKNEYAEQHGVADTGTGTFVGRLYERDSFPAQRTGHTGTWEQQEESYVNRKIDDWYEGKASSLYDSIRESGVKSPIRLGEDEGMMNKPMVVGGHHRLAAAANINENQFVPVLHHEDIGEARSPKTTSGYPYT